MLLCALAVLSLSGLAAANNETDDGFIWIDANTRIKVKKVSTAAGGASAADIETLGETVRERVKAHSGVELEWEIKRVGVKA